MPLRTDVVDISENELLALNPEVFAMLLKDHTRSTPERCVNIFWATSDYKDLGHEYKYNAQILPHLVTGDNNKVVMPRVLKERAQQTLRTRDMAEVFTPAWICNAQNNLVDDAWFGRKNVFNTPCDVDGEHTWIPTEGKIEFPEGRTWQQYVNAKRLEVTCGEAPYMVSRYDTTTGQLIPLSHRIGILDRKMRIVAENVTTRKQWRYWSRQALRSCYAYEWQGDSLLLAREAFFISFIEYHNALYPDVKLQLDTLRSAAYVISWNVWQMDGLRGVVPDSCKATKVKDPTAIFADYVSSGQTVPCPGCLSGKLTEHNGDHCIIRDWSKPREKQRISFIKLMTSLPNK